MKPFRLIALFLCLLNLQAGAQLLELWSGDALDIGNAEVTGNAITLEAWVRTDENFGNILSKDSAGLNLSYRITPTSFTIRTFNNGTTGPTSEHTLTSPVLIDFGRWHHVAGVYDGFTMSFYLNGCLVAQRNAEGNLNLNTYNTQIGKEYGTGASNLQGFLDEIQIWTEARTADNIVADMGGLTNPVAAPNVLAYYDFTSDFQNQKNPGTYDGSSIGTPQLGQDNLPKAAQFALADIDIVDARCDAAVGSIAVNTANNAIFSISPSGEASSFNPGRSLSGLYSGSYHVHVQDNFGCILDTLVFVPGGGIAPSTVSYNEPICSGNLLNMQVNNADLGNLTVEWTGPSGFTANSTPAIINNANNLDNEGTYTVTLTDVNGCIQANTLHVEIFGIDGNPKISTNSPLCENATLLMDTDVDDAIYYWSGPGFSAKSKLAMRPDINLSEGGNYTLNVVFEGCLSGTGNTSVTVTSSPAMPNIYTTNSIHCYGDTMFLYADPVNGATYNWSGPQMTSSAQNPIIPFTTDLDSGLYQCSITMNGCTSDSASINMIVFPNSTPNLGNDSTFCYTDELRLFPGSYQDYLWHTGSRSPVFNVTEADTIWVTVRDENNCITTDSLILEAFCPGLVYVPNAFTPNGDQYNGTFKVVAENIIEMDFRLYTRGGQLIFETQDPSVGWDGYINNKPAAQGTYIWMLDYKQRRIQGVVEDSKNGSVILLR